MKKIFKKKYHNSNSTTKPFNAKTLPLLKQNRKKNKCFVEHILKYAK